MFLLREERGMPKPSRTAKNYGWLHIRKKEGISMMLSDILAMGFVYKSKWGKGTDIYYSEKLHRYAKVDEENQAEIFERGEE